MEKKAWLLLEDGTFVEGRGLGFPTEFVGEFVFNTAMTGYEEVISDPSYREQAVVFSSSHIGNTGINFDDMESELMHCGAVVVNRMCHQPDHWRTRMSLEDFLYQNRRCGMDNVDTRWLVQRLRRRGSMLGVVSLEDSVVSSLQEKIEVYRASTRLRRHSALTATGSHRRGHVLNPGGSPRLALLDFGAKRSIVRQLVHRGVEVHWLPIPCTVAEIEAIQPDGLFFSNGPGDPRVLYQMPWLQRLMSDVCQRYPCFGICLGHQLLALNFGATIVKLPFGHHAVNHPVSPYDTKHSSRVYITSQNHNYAVSRSALPSDLRLTWVHRNDQTVAGIAHRHLPVGGVQFHPEAAPGPTDVGWLFDEFIMGMAARHGISDTNADGQKQIILEATYG